MSDPRTMAQEYGREGIRALMIINGGAAVGLLSQASELINMQLGDDVASALLAWATGLVLAVVCWLFGFLSLRHLDRSTENEATHSNEITLSNRYLFSGQIAFVLSLAAFVAGSVLLAKSFA